MVPRSKPAAPAPGTVRRTSPAHSPSSSTAQAHGVVSTGPALHSAATPSSSSSLASACGVTPLQVAQASSSASGASDLPGPGQSSSFSSALAHGAKRKPATSSSSDAPADGGVKCFKPNALAAGTHLRREPLPRPWMIGLDEYFLGGNSDDEEEGDTARFAAGMQAKNQRPPSPASDGVSSDDDVVQSTTRRRYYGQPARLAFADVGPANVPPAGNVAPIAPTDVTPSTPPAGQQTQQAVEGFLSLAEFPKRALQVLPSHSQPIPTDCVAYGDNLRSEPGPLPDVISPPTSAPSARLTTMGWRVVAYSDEYADFSIEEIDSHIVGSLLPRLEPCNEDDANEEDGKAVEAVASVPTMMSVPRDSIDFSGETKFLDFARIVIKGGRPTWEVSTEFDLHVGKVRHVFLGFGCRPTNAPGPLSSLSLRLPPRKMGFCFDSSIPRQQREELAAAAAAAEWEM